MPNWCENKLRVSHSDPAALEKFMEAWNSGALLQTLLPCPQELIDTMAGSIGGSADKSQQYKKELLEFKEQLNLKYFGYRNWYDWCVAEWGTKWDIGRQAERHESAEVEADAQGNEFIEVDFESAWSPPTGAYDKLTDLGYIIEAYYYEPGVGFCGRYDSDGDQTFEIRGGYKWVRKNVPRDIDEAFRITENMQQYAEEE